VRAVVQRVKQAKVTIGEEVVGAISEGLVIFLGVGENDDQADARYLAEKIAYLRIFNDTNEKLNLAAVDVGAEMLVVSQFTLFGDCRKGRRPSFAAAAPPVLAKDLYEYFVDCLKEVGLIVATGRFQEDMLVTLENHGPVTLLLDSDRTF
jgi:D-tyrosyl-tRNA(Tyr) deacylase